MSNWRTYTLEERKVMLQKSSAEERLPDYAVEKDWWVTMTLKALFQTGCADKLTFKGGTSLSKGWNLIQRFSEDIDLALSHSYFGITPSSNSQLLKLRKLSHKYLTQDFVAELDAELHTVGLQGYKLYPVIEKDGRAVDSDADPTMLVLEYPSISEHHSQYVPAAVKIEISCLSMEEPFEIKEISTIISKHYPEDDLGTSAKIPTVLPERTFLEKAFLLCEEFQKNEPRSYRMSRHLYDLDRLKDTEYGKRALADDQLYTNIVEHRRKFYHVGYADYDKDYRDRIEFYPPDNCIKAWESDYNDLLTSFVYGDRKTFAELLASIAELQTRFRNGE